MREAQGPRTRQQVAELRKARFWDAVQEDARLRGPNEQRKEGGESANGRTVTYLCTYLSMETT